MNPVISLSNMSKPRSGGKLVTLIQRAKIMGWGPALCATNRHKMETVESPLGEGKPPQRVGRCVRCGVVMEVEPTPFGGVVIGRWESMEALKESKNER